MNKKGFMMAELVVVSSIVLVTMVAMYASFNKIYSTYKTRISYYDITTLYRLGYYKDVLFESMCDGESCMSKLMGDNRDKIVFEVYNSANADSGYAYIPTQDRIDNVSDRVFMVKNNGSIGRDLFTSYQDVHLTFLDYVDYLNTSVEFLDEDDNKTFDYLMVMERCNVKVNDDGTKNVDENDCTYAYLHYMIEPS